MTLYLRTDLTERVSDWNCLQPSSQRPHAYSASILKDFSFIPKVPVDLLNAFVVWDDLKLRSF